MLVLFFTDAVELQVNAVLTGSLCRFTKLNVFGEANSVGSGQDAIEAYLLCISDGVEIVRRDCRFAAREKNNDLPSWFERNGAIQDRFGVFEGWLVHIANLVCIHEAGITHHVAAVG